MSEQISFLIGESSQVAETRRFANTRARDLGFDEAEAGKVAIVVTELATNLVKHAGGGEIIIRDRQYDSPKGLEILALDKGAGIASLDEAMRDGHSTAGSAGTGLGAISRMSDTFDIWSAPEKGTVVMTRFWPGRIPPATPRDIIADAICIPLAGEERSGDSWAMSSSEGRSLILAVDGLGHGPLAATAAQEAVVVFEENSGLAPAEIMEMIHGTLRSTRGAAAAITEIDHNAGTIRYVGVGNISAAVISPERTHRMVSHNGTLGHEVRKIQEFNYIWPPDALLVMHTDGIATQWSLDAYPGATKHSTSVIAGILYRDFSRRRDDTTVIVAREPETRS